MSLLCVCVCEKNSEEVQFRVWVDMWEREMVQVGVGIRYRGAHDEHHGGR